MNPHHPGHSAAYPHHPSLSSSPHHSGPHHGYSTGGGGGGGAGNGTTTTPDLPSPHSPPHGPAIDPATPYGSLQPGQGMGTNGHHHGGAGMMTDHPHHPGHPHPHLPGHPAYPPVNHNNNCTLKKEFSDPVAISYRELGPRDARFDALQQIERSLLSVADGNATSSRRVGSKNVLLSNIPKLSLVIMEVHAHHYSAIASRMNQMKCFTGDKIVSAPNDDDCSSLDFVIWLICLRRFGCDKPWPISAKLAARMDAVVSPFHPELFFFAVSLSGESVPLCCATVYVA
ncbi:hypothetical protein K0M31_003475 [Melipona bicolor]|uniref:Uncharacterized protein n=1 Tax=Melipona bicolor TaxID=60889 RepID=A0AA40FZ17_9HYME|nr:hypothetical protein K0M31_003475 [Melipona bicolor]